MKSIVIKLIICLAIGLLAGEIAGNSSKYSKYYILSDGDKMEVTLLNWQSNNYNNFPPERIFNKNMFYTYLISFSSICALVIFGYPMYKGRN